MGNSLLLHFDITKVIGLLAEIRSALSSDSASVTISSNISDIPKGWVVARRLLNSQ